MHVNIFLKGYSYICHFTNISPFSLFIAAINKIHSFFTWRGLVIVGVRTKMTELKPGDIFQSGFSSCKFGGYFLNWNYFHIIVNLSSITLGSLKLFQDN